MNPHPLSGIYAAALTPLATSGAPDLAALPRYLDFLAERGCHGALLLGTTGEGPSFSSAERHAIWAAAAEWRQSRPGFRLLAGTGTPALTETIEFTQSAYQLGYEAAVVLPPYYFRNASQDGLFDWFAQLIEATVPEDRWLLGYHIPQVSGVALPPGLLARLAAAYPDRFGGLKDSSGDPAQAAAYIEALPGCAVLVGNDQLLAGAMQGGAAGAITAGANLWSPLLRQIYDSNASAQDAVDPLRAAMDAHAPAPAFLKAMLRRFHDLDLGTVRAPLHDLDDKQAAAAARALEGAGYE
jgi:4-hydroxy-tetrahydrodipicolinate synthase